MATFFTMHADILDFTNGNLVGKDSMRVHFDLNVKPGDFVISTGDTRPSLIDVGKTITGYIRSNGRMYDKPSISAAPYDLSDTGNLGVRLLASTPDLNIAVSYRVTFEQVINGVNVVYRSFVTSTVPDDDVAVNLAAYAPAPRAGG